MLTFVPNHAQLAVGRLVSQYADKPNFVGLLTCFANRIQDVEDAFWALLTQRLIDSAVGAQLDVLGVIVGEARQGFGDDDYRLQLRGRLLANRSAGTMQDFYSVFSLIAASGTTFTIVEDFPAAVFLDLGQVAPVSGILTFLLNFLKAIRAAGVRGFLGYQSTDDAHTFTFADGLGLGFGDAADSTVGGELSSLLEA